MKLSPLLFRLGSVSLFVVILDLSLGLRFAYGMGQRPVFDREEEGDTRGATGLDLNPNRFRFPPNFKEEFLEEPLPSCSVAPPKTLSDHLRCGTLSPIEKEMVQITAQVNGHLRARTEALQAIKDKAEVDQLRAFLVDRRAGWVAIAGAIAGTILLGALLADFIRDLKDPQVREAEDWTGFSVRVSSMIVVTGWAAWVPLYRYHLDQSHKVNMRSLKEQERLAMQELATRKRLKEDTDRLFEVFKKHQRRNWEFFRLIERWENRLPGGDDMLWGMEKLYLVDNKPQFLEGDLSLPIYVTQQDTFGQRVGLRPEDIDRSLRTVYTYEVGGRKLALPLYRNRQDLSPGHIADYLGYYAQSEDYLRREIAEFPRYKHLWEKLTGFFHEPMARFVASSHGWLSEKNSIPTIATSPVRLDAFGIFRKDFSQLDALIDGLSYVANEKAGGCFEFYQVERSEFDHLDPEIKHFFKGKIDELLVQKLNFQKVANVWVGQMFDLQPPSVLRKLGAPDVENLVRVMGSDLGVLAVEKRAKNPSYRPPVLPTPWDPFKQGFREERGASAAGASAFLGGSRVEAQQYTPEPISPDH